jgi:cytidylate kinase
VAREAGTHLPMVTISRQAGCRAHAVAEELVLRLAPLSPPGSPPWTIFDRNLVGRVLEDHGLPDRLAEFMPEDRVTEIADTLDEFFGVHPSARRLVWKTADTILRLATVGNVVIVGRAANILTRDLDFAVHVRLVGSEERRVRRVQQSQDLDPRAAADHVHRLDRGRRRYVRKYYERDIDDPLLYHLIVNTDRIASAEAGAIIARAVAVRREAS